MRPARLSGLNAEHHRDPVGSRYGASVLSWPTAHYWRHERTFRRSVRPARVRLIVSPVERRLKGGEAAIEQAGIPARKGLQPGLEDQYKWMEMLSRLRSGSPH